MAAVQAYEEDLLAELLGALADMPQVTTYGRPARRTATVWFRVAGHSPADVARHLAEVGVNVWHGHNYAWEVAGALGIRDDGGAVRAGLVHYNDRSDAEQLLAGLAALAP